MLYDLELSTASDKLHAHLPGPSPLVLKTNVKLLSIIEKFPKQQKIIDTILKSATDSKLDWKKDIVGAMDGPLVVATLPVGETEGVPLTPIIYTHVKHSGHWIKGLKTLCEQEKKTWEENNGGHFCTNGPVRFGVWKDHLVVTPSNLKIEEQSNTNGLIYSNQTSEYNQSSLLTTAFDVRKIITHSIQCTAVVQKNDAHDGSHGRRSVELYPLSRSA